MFWILSVVVVDFPIFPTGFPKPCAKYFGASSRARARAPFDAGATVKFSVVGLVAAGRLFGRPVVGRGRVCLRVSRVRARVCPVGPPGFVVVASFRPDTCPFFFFSFLFSFRDRT